MSNETDRRGNYTCKVCGWDFTDFSIKAAKEHEEECKDVDKYRE